MNKIKVLILVFISIISMVNVSNAFADTYKFSGELTAVHTNLEEYLSIGDTFDFFLDGPLIKTSTTPFNETWSFESLNSPIVKFDSGLFITAESVTVENLFGNTEINLVGEEFSNSALPTRLQMFVLGRAPLGSSFEEVLRHSVTLPILTGAGRNTTARLTYIGAVPEPSSYALLLAGLGLIGVINFRMRS